MDQQQIPQIQDDEIDLFELFGQLWDAKWLIIAVTLITGGMGAVYAKFLQQKPYVATLEIRQLEPLAVAQYQQYNSLVETDNVLPDNSLVETDNVLPDVPKVTSEYLQELFVTGITERRMVNKILEASPFFARQDDQDPIEFQAELRKNALEFVKFESPDLEKDPLAANLTVKLELPNGQATEDDVLALAKNLIGEATNYAHETYGQRFAAAVRAKNFENDFKKEDLRIDRELQLVDYEARIKSRLAFLSEQAAIARATGIKRSSIKSVEGGQDATVVTNIEGNAPYYLRGYESIESEMQKIESRENPELFINQIAKIDAEIRRIDANKDLERVIALFNETDLRADRKRQFQAVTTNIDALVIERSSKSMLILALSLVLGGMVAVVYVLIRSAVRNRQAAKAAANPA